MYASRRGGGGGGGGAGGGRGVDFNSLKVPFSGLPSHSDRILASSIHIG